MLCRVPHAQLCTVALSCHKVHVKYIVVIIIPSHQNHIKMVENWKPGISHQLVHRWVVFISFRLHPQHWLDQFSTFIHLNCLSLTIFVRKGEQYAMSLTTSLSMKRVLAASADLLDQVSKISKVSFLFFFPNCSFCWTTFFLVSCFKSFLFIKHGIFR